MRREQLAVVLAVGGLTLLALSLAGTTPSDESPPVIGVIIWRAACGGGDTVSWSRAVPRAPPRRRRPGPPTFLVREAGPVHVTDANPLPAAPACLGQVNRRHQYRQPRSLRPGLSGQGLPGTRTG